MKIPCTISILQTEYLFKMSKREDIIRLIVVGIFVIALIGVVIIAFVAFFENNKAETFSFEDVRYDEFDWNLIKTILTNESNNVIVSTFSIQIILSLLSEAAGKESKTLKELLTILPKIESSELRRKFFTDKISSLKSESKEYQLNIASKIYLHEILRPNKQFESIAKTYYNVLTDKLDFRNVETSVNSINSWSSDETNGLIKDIVSNEDVDGVFMVLLNALYFKGSWVAGFNKESTIVKRFDINENENVEAEFMSQTSLFDFNYNDYLNANLIRLPYKGNKFSMVVLLPTDPNGLDALIKKLDPIQLYSSINKMSKVNVDILLPKFDFEYTSHMKDALVSLGVAEIFTNSASLKGLAEGEAEFKVSNLIQKAALKIDEEGSVVAAASAAVITSRMGSFGPKFYATHPFLFYIEDETTSTILFAGKLVNPLKKA